MILNTIIQTPFSPLTNFGIEEDQDDPKEAAHLDYKYLKSYEGPLAKPATQSNKAESDAEREKLIRPKKNANRVIYSVERKKFGGIRMCQRCLRTKVTNELRRIIFLARSLPPLFIVQSLCVEDGSPLPVGCKLHRLLQLQVLHEHAVLLLLNYLAADLDLLPSGG